MKPSRRSRRMRRQHRRNTLYSSLNLVSLMDIFTILVFFLLANSSDVEVLPNAKIIQLPASVAEQKPRETSIVMITRRDILLQGKRVMGLDEALASKAASLLPLVNALKQPMSDATETKENADPSGPFNENNNKEITVLAGKTVPYKLLKKVILSCSLAKYRKVSLAVLQKSHESE